jgi:RHS repeat-associated protein
LKIAAISSHELPSISEGETKNKYLYNDKELWDEGDLDWYDYGFRNYDPQIGRFTQLDPLPHVKSGCRCRKSVTCGM